MVLQLFSKQIFDDSKKLSKYQINPLFWNLINESLLKDFLRILWLYCVTFVSNVHTYLSA